MSNQPDNREASIRIRLSDEEKAELEEQAWQARQSVSAYVRDRLNLTAAARENAKRPRKRRKGKEKEEGDEG